MDRIGRLRRDPLGAPIFDVSRTAVAAIGISGPADRLNANRMRAWAPRVMAAAAAISRELGFTEPATAHVAV